MSFDEDNDTTEPTRNWWTIAAAAVVAACVLAAVIWWVTGRGGNESTPAPQAPKSIADRATPTAPAATGSFKVTSDGVSAGKGGTGLAPDSKTQIGFPGTCNGAVAAISAYLPTLTSNVAPVKSGATVVPGQAPATLASTLAYVLDGASSDMRSKIEHSAQPNADSASEVDAAQGGYRIVQCVPQDSATIAVFYCTKFTHSYTTPEFEGRTLCTTSTYQLKFLGTPSDWRIAARDYPGVAGPGRTRTGALLKGPLNRSQRQQLLGKIEGWREYANAPK